MKILKKILIGIVILIGLILIAGLFVKRELDVEREITINKPRQEVFNYVKYLKNQNNYSKWGTMDPNMKKDFKGIDGTVGFVSYWDGNKDVGKGEQEIKKINEGERIDYEIRFIKPFASTAPAYMTTDAIADNKTRVKWGFNSRMVYPMNVMRLFVDMEGMLGKDFETGLTNLKTILEKNN